MLNYKHHRLNKIHLAGMPGEYTYIRYNVFLNQFRRKVYNFLTWKPLLKKLFKLLSFLREMISFWQAPVYDIFYILCVYILYYIFISVVNILSSVLRNGLPYRLYEFIIFINLF